MIWEMIARLDMSTIVFEKGDILSGIISCYTDDNDESYPYDKVKKIYWINHDILAIVKMKKIFISYYTQMLCKVNLFLFAFVSSIISRYVIIVRFIFLQRWMGHG